MANPWDNLPIYRSGSGQAAGPEDSAQATPSTPPAAGKNPWDGLPVYRSASPEMEQGIGSRARTTASDNGPSFGTQAARGIGIGARALVQGALDLPALVSDNLIAKPVNAGMDLMFGKGEGPSRLKMAGEAADDLMSRAGLPEAQTAGERIAQGVTRSAAGALSGVGIGAAAAKAASPVVSGIGETMKAAPVMQLASGAASGGASAITKEAGGGEGAQMVAALAGGLAPSVGGFAATGAARAAIRGGEAGREQMARNIETFEKAAGVTPTLGQATQSRAIQGLETTLANVPGGSGLMVRRGEVQAKAMQDAVDDLSQQLAPNATGWGAGEAINKGVDAFKNSVKTTQNMLYGKLDDLMPPQTPVSVDRTRQALSALNEGIEGAPNLSVFFRNAKLRGIDKALVDDLEVFAKGNVAPGMQGMGVAPAASELPYQALQKLRTMVGREISENSLVADVPRSKWRALYAALSDDLGSAAAKAGPDAEQAWSRANQYTKASIQRLDQLESIVNREAPERIFKAATSGLSDGGTQINRLMKSMPEENRREVTAAVLQRLGRARNSSQNEMGDAFSAETFLTNLAAMSPPARQALFSNSGFPGLREKVEQMGRVASLRREGAQVFANPSGTARQGTAIGFGASLATALATGNAPMASTLIGGLLAARGAASALTNPRYVRGLAERTQLSAAAPAVAINSAAQAGQIGEAREQDGAKTFRATRELGK